MLLLIYVFVFQGILYQNCLCDELLLTNRHVKNGEFMDRLFDGYTKNMLPVLNIEKPVMLNLTLCHMSIDNLDMKHKIVSARIVLCLAWTDEYLTWNSSEFKNLSRFSIEANSIWLPDLIIGNKEELFTFIKPENMQKPLVNSNGIVEAWPYMNVELGIDLNIHKYPFDSQVCEFEFSSWTYDVLELDISELHEDLESNEFLHRFRQSGEWDLIKREGNRFVHTLDNYITNFTVIQYKFTIKRRWLYTILNLVAPVVLTSLLNPMSFLLPVDSGERISLSNTVFLTLAVFFSIVNNSLPETSDGVPVIVVYIGLQMLGSALTIVCTILSLALYHNRQDISKSILTKFFLKERNEKKDNRNFVTDSDVLDKNMENQENEKVWMKASNYLDKICFWLSLGWNISLLTMVVVEANTH